MEGRRCLDTEPLEGKMKETLCSEDISTKLERIAKLAREAPEMVITTLAHHMDVEWMSGAYRRTRKDGATGVDGQTADEYAAGDLEGKLRTLLEKAKSGTYRAPPVKRVRIPKGDGRETRPLGMPTFEDKVLQRAVVMLLEAVYEQDFKECSYGFRPGRSAHQALEVLRNHLMNMGGGWVLEVDIRKFFDTVDHHHLREILCRRVRDGVLLRLIGKWLNAGVMEDGEMTYPEAGTPQGGVISPMLANIYLHEVLDTWFERDVRPRMRGRTYLVRYADDVVMCFEWEDDARRVEKVLAKRLGRYGLTLHPEKTRLVEFCRPDRRRLPQKCGGRPGTFDMLGFTHYWGLSRKGNRVVKKQTAPDRFSRGLKQVAKWCRKNRHKEVSQQRQALGRKLQGHYGYYGITGNFRGIHRFYEGVKRVWWKWLNRRSRRAEMPWERMTKLLERHPLPLPKIVHPYSAPA